MRRSLTYNQSMDSILVLRCLAFLFCNCSFSQHKSTKTNKLRCEKVKKKSNKNQNHTFSFFFSFCVLYSKPTSTEIKNSSNVNWCKCVQQLNENKTDSWTISLQFHLFSLSPYNLVYFFAWQGRQELCPFGGHHFTQFNRYLLSFSKTQTKMNLLNN